MKMVMRTKTIEMGRIRASLQLIPCERSEPDRHYTRERVRYPDYTRERRRPLLRVYFTGRRRFGSILASPVPLFTSMI